MPNPAFYERQRRRVSTWDMPRFLRSYDETLAGDLLLPRGLQDRLTALVEQAGSRLELGDERTAGDRRPFGFAADLDPEQQRARRRPGRATNSACWSPRPAPARR